MPKPRPRMTKLSLSANGCVKRRSAYSLSSLMSRSVKVSLLPPSLLPLR